MVTSWVILSVPYRFFSMVRQIKLFGFTIGRGVILQIQATLGSFLRSWDMASVVLSFGGLDGRLLESNYETCINWLEDATRLLDLKIFSLTHAPIHPKPPRTHRWIKPPNDSLKINVDATIVVSAVGIRVITRDCEDFVLGGRAVYMDYKMDVDWVEAEALGEGIIWAHNNNVTRAIFETGCAGLVNRFKSRHEDISIYGYRLKEIFRLLDSFIDIKLEWVGCSSNRVADCLCKLVVKKRCTFPFDMEYPSDIHELVIVDSC
ncbi:hypothetical protein Gotri_016165 [Gossypium trilobum]|uniref:RNase H type-1 domain-containing protein n=1 Tax=Gossypium trilobum TaxID=34281 RepID=A0A7J9E3V9_9ROSI|nr:hypothetical protein [Gossypium trilobum]